MYYEIIILYWFSLLATFWSQKCRLIWIVRGYVAASKKRAVAKSRVIVGEWPFRMVTIENTSIGAGRAKGCVNNARLSTFIREIWRENFVNETRTNKRFAIAQKRPMIPCDVKVPFANSLAVCFHSYNNNINAYFYVYWHIRKDTGYLLPHDLLIRYFDIIGWFSGDSFYEVQILKGRKFNRINSYYQSTFVTFRNDRLLRLIVQ